MASLFMLSPKASRNAADPTGYFCTSSGTWVYDSGTESLKFTSGVSGAVARFTKASLGPNTGQWSCDFEIGAASTANVTILDITAPNGHFTLQITSGNILQLWGTAQLGSNGANLGVGSFNNIVVSWTITNTTTFTINVWVNGTSSIVVSSGTLVAGGTASTVFGWGTASAGNSKWVYIKNIFATNTYSATYPGHILVTYKIPSGDNVANWDTDLGAATTVNNRYVNCKEVPQSDTNGRQQAATAAAEETYHFEAASVGVVDLTNANIKDSMGWVRAKIVSTSGSPTPKLTFNGADNAITLTTSIAGYFVFAGSTDYPANYNGQGIGMKSSGSSGDTVMYEAGVMVAYAGFIHPNSLALPGVFATSGKFHTIFSNSLALTIVFATSARLRLIKANSLALAIVFATSGKLRWLKTNSLALAAVFTTSGRLRKLKTNSLILAGVFVTSGKFHKIFPNSLSVASIFTTSGRLRKIMANSLTLAIVFSTSGRLKKTVFNTLTLPVSFVTSGRLRKLTMNSLTLPVVFSTSGKFHKIFPNSIALTGVFSTSGKFHKIFPNSLTLASTFVTSGRLRLIKLNHIAYNIVFSTSGKFHKIFSNSINFNAVFGTFGRFPGGAIIYNSLSLAATFVTSGRFRRLHLNSLSLAAVFTTSAKLRKVQLNRIAYNVVFVVSAKFHKIFPNSIIFNAVFTTIGRLFQETPAVGIPSIPVAHFKAVGFNVEPPAKVDISTESETVNSPANVKWKQ